MSSRAQQLANKIFIEVRHIVFYLPPTVIKSELPQKRISVRGAEKPVRALKRASSNPGYAIHIVDWMHYSILGLVNQQWIFCATPFTTSGDTWNAYFGGASPRHQKSASQNGSVA